MAWAGGCESWRAANSCGAHPVLVCVVGCRRFALRCRCDCACSDTRRHLAEKSYWYVVVTCVKWRVCRSCGCREATLARRCVLVVVPFVAVHFPIATASQPVQTLYVRIACVKWFVWSRHGCHVIGALTDCHSVFGDFAPMRQYVCGVHACESVSV